MEGSLSTNEIPAFWNQQYKAYLDINVPDDRQGALQDVHWSHGSFGYFPTYSLGSFYAAQFYDRAKKEVKDMEGEIANGNTAPLLQWLRTKIHSKGRFFTSEELCREITGEGLNGDYFLSYAKKKYGSIYQ
ncbi:MAG: hypothetical protein EON98_14210 [Chitinophagaceae bacterium]|nr:MAG: hypothetical protein EON98_14210 [Chitinophagaceae bacterium]